jgi:hypothetical protein
MKSQKNELQAIARARLYPSLSNPNYLLLRSRRITRENWIEQLPERGLTVLDVGGSYQPYRSLLGERIRPYIALDLQKTELVDGVGSGEAGPFAASSFDLVIATQVFEYFRDPARAAEADRPGAETWRRSADERLPHGPQVFGGRALALHSQGYTGYPGLLCPSGGCSREPYSWRVCSHRPSGAEHVSSEPLAAANLRPDLVSGAEHSRIGAGTPESDDE